MFTQKKALNGVLVRGNFNCYIVSRLTTCHSTCMKFLSIGCAIKLGKAEAEAVARKEAERIFIEKRFNTKHQSHHNHIRT